MSLSKSLGNDRANRKRRGLTLIEAAMVLTILALVVAGVMLFYQNASTSQKISAASGQISAVQQAVRSAYAGRPNYTGLANADIANQLPTSMVNGASDLRNAFGGQIVVAANNGGGSSGSAFTISFAGLPSEACLRLSAVDMGRAALGISVNGDTGTPPMAPAAAQDACGTGNNSTIIWTLR